MKLVIKWNIINLSLSYFFEFRTARKVEMWLPCFSISWLLLFGGKGIPIIRQKNLQLLSDQSRWLVAVLELFFSSLFIIVKFVK